MASCSLKMAALHSYHFSNIQASVTFLFFLFNIDEVCGRLHGLLRTSHAFTVAVPFSQFLGPHLELASSLSFHHKSLNVP